MAMNSKSNSFKGYVAPFYGGKRVTPTQNNTEISQLYEGSIYKYDNKDRLDFVRYSEAWDYHLSQVDWGLFITFTWRQRAKRAHSLEGRQCRKKDFRIFIRGICK